MASFRHEVIFLPGVAGAVGLRFNLFQEVQKRCRCGGCFLTMCVPTIRAVATPDALEEVDRLLDSIWSANPHVPALIRMRLGIAVGEISTNIVKHATKDLERPVGLQVWVLVRDDDVLVTFADDGHPAADELLSREMPPDLDEGGRGIPLARATLSLLEYRRTDGFNVWTLVSERF